MRWALAQINIGRLVAPRGDCRVCGFFNRLDEINLLARTSPGFIWGILEEGGNAAEVSPGLDERLILNISVWSDIERLSDFVYRSAHARVLARRRDWFEPYEGAHQALWWVPASSRPTVSDGLSRLWHIEHFGPTASAFTFAARFAPPDDGQD